MECTKINNNKYNFLRAFIILLDKNQEPDENIHTSRLYESSPLSKRSVIPAKW